MTFDSHSYKYTDCFHCISSGFDSYIHLSFLYENWSLWRFKRKKKKLVVWPFLNTVYPKKRLSLSRGYMGKIRITHRINTNEFTSMFLSEVKQNVERNLWHWQEFSSHKVQTHILLSFSNKKVPGVDVRSRYINTWIIIIMISNIEIQCQAEHSKSVLFILSWTSGSALYVQGHLPRVEGPVFGARIRQRVSARVHESLGGKSHSGLCPFSHLAFKTDK